jgi:hypothetical protein
MHLLGRHRLGPGRHSAAQAGIGIIPAGPRLLTRLGRFICSPARPGRLHSQVGRWHPSPAGLVPRLPRPSSASRAGRLAPIPAWAGFPGWAPPAGSPGRLPRLGRGLASRPGWAAGLLAPAGPLLLRPRLGQDERPPAGPDLPPGRHLLPCPGWAGSGGSGLAGIFLQAAIS